MEILPASPNPRQTLSFLADLFQKHGLRPKKKLGQNFLIDLNLLDVIVRAAELTPADVVLEVGTGTGSLTAQLADRAGAVLSVEVDADFHTLVTASRFRERPNLVLMHADILRNKNQIQPRVLEKLGEVHGLVSPARLKLGAQLPYVVATPVISNVLLLDLPLERMVVTVQWEIAERLWARPGTKDYGALSVLMQTAADVKLVRRLPPAVFWPRPKVDSAIVLIRPNPERRRAAPALPVLRNFLRDLYAHRRKNLRGALAALPSGRRAKDEVDRLLAELGLDGTLRAETLSVEDHWRLCDAFAC